MPCYLHLVQVQQALTTILPPKATQGIKKHMKLMKTTDSILVFKKRLYRVTQHFTLEAESILTFTTLRENSADEKLIIFFLFPRPQDMTFHANCLH